jgi:hypothetical protein
MFVVFLSETLTWQQQQHNVATSVIMTTHLNWRPLGARNVRISCVPTVTGTILDLQQPNNMENYQKLPSSILSIKNRCTKHDNKYEFYCSIHGDPCCAMCTRDDHRHCQELRPIFEVTENAKSSPAIVHIERDLKDIDAAIEKMKSDITIIFLILINKKENFYPIFQTCVNRLATI